MKKGDAPPARAGPGPLVHQAKPEPAAALEGPVQVGNAETDMVNAGPATLQEAGDRAVTRERVQQLDIHVVEGQGDDGRAVGDFRGPGHDAEYVPVETQGGLDVRDGDTDMGDPGMIRHSGLRETERDDT